MCTLGIAGCSIELKGYEMSATSAITVLASGECGATDAVVADWTGAVDIYKALDGSVPTIESSTGYGYGYGYVAGFAARSLEGAQALASRTFRRMQAELLSSATVTLGTPTGGSPGDTYKICWGSDPSTLEDFNVELDPNADLIGPVAGDLLYCVLGTLSSLLP